jgi:hypothetical protein
VRAAARRRLGHPVLGQRLKRVPWRGLASAVLLVEPALARIRCMDSLPSDRCRIGADSRARRPVGGVSLCRRCSSPSGSDTSDGPSGRA